MAVDKDSKKITFGVAKGKDIQRTAGTKRERGPAICPFCEQPTSEADMRRAGIEGTMGERLVCVVVEGKNGKDYRPVEEADLAAFREAAAMDVKRPTELILPEINAQDAAEDISNSTGIRVHLYGMKTWGSLFNARQLVALQTFISCLHEALKLMEDEIPDREYRQAIAVYLGLWLDRMAVFNNSVSRWKTKDQAVAPPFSGQAIPMMWDYPEVNPLADSSGTASTQLRYMIKVIEHERVSTTIDQPEPNILLGNAAALPLNDCSLDYVVTDPPYDDAISYADLSDFFYVWLKRSIGIWFPDVFATPLAPKSDEATSLKHRHEGSEERARNHYRRLLKESFSEALRVVRDPKLVTVMFAH